VCLWLSLIAFVSGGVMVVAGAARVLHHAEASEARGAAMPARIFAAPRSIGAGFYLNSIRSIFPPVSSAVR
jgi:hypothetical protein